jgi:hypothetical protein
MEIVIFAGERSKRRLSRWNLGGKESFTFWKESRQAFVNSVVKSTLLFKCLRPSIDLSIKEGNVKRTVEIPVLEIGFLA